MSVKEGTQSSLCSTSDCDNEVYAKDVCRSCYDRIRRTVGYPGQGRCIEPGCDRPAVNNNYCSGHKYLGIGEDELFRRCKWCGIMLEDWKKNSCPECTRKGTAWRRGIWYLCVYDPSEHSPYKGGHFRNKDFKSDLMMGVMSLGMVVEKWHNGEYVGAFIVSRWSGRRIRNPLREVLVEISYTPRGDGRFLVI